MILGEKYEKVYNIRAFVNNILCNIYLTLYYNFVPGGGHDLWCLLLLPCSIVLTVRAILSLKEMKSRKKFVCICLNLLIGIVIFFINIIIAYEMVGDWGIISKIG